MANITQAAIHARVNARHRKMKMHDDGRLSTYRRWAVFLRHRMEECDGMPPDMNPEQLVDSYRLAKNFIKELDRCE